MALFKRKDKDTKKGGETTIGKIIYGFLLFMPLLSIGARCLYVVFNKNAYKSYSNFNSETHEYVNVNNFNNLIVGNTYKFISNNTGATTITNNNSYMMVENVKIISSSRAITEEQAETITRFGLYLYNNNTLLRFNNDSGIADIAFNSGYAEFTFTYLGLINVNTTNQFENYFDRTIYSNNLTNYGNTLDNVFEYSINQTQESNIYNWAKETGTYTVLYNTTTGLGITNEFIPMLMAYWLIVSVIYFLFDIALILIWAVHKKIHELSEAI